MIRGNLYQIWKPLSAGGKAEFAARLEGTARWHCVQGRYCTFDGFKGTVAIGFQVGHGLQKAAGIGMCRCLKDLRFVSEFDDASSVHHSDTICDLRNHGEVVGDKKHSQTKPGAQLGEQVENLGLNGYIEGRRGFVGDEQLRAVDDGHGDHDALAHASGELVRIAAGALAGIGNGNVAHAFDSSTPGFRFGDVVVSEDSFGDLLANAHDRVERGHGLLENHGNARPAKLAQLIGRQVGQMRGGTVVFFKTVLKSYFAPDKGSGWKQAHDGKRGNGFPGARFAD